MTRAIDILLYALILGAMFEWFKTVWDQRKILASAGWTTVILIILCLAVGFSVTSWAYSTVIASVREQKATVDERLKARDEQIEQLKAKVGTESPDEIQKKMKGLENQVESLRAGMASLRPTPRFTDDQNGKIMSAITTVHGETIGIDIDNAARTCSAVVEQLRELFGRAGWTVQSGMLFALIQYPHTGIGVYIRNRASLTAAESAVLRAFASAGVKFDMFEDPKKQGPTSITVTDALP